MQFLRILESVQVIFHVLSHYTPALHPVSHRLSPSCILNPWDSQGERIGIGCHPQFQEIFSTQIEPSCVMTSMLEDRFFRANTTWATISLYMATHKHAYVYVESLGIKFCCLQGAVYILQEAYNCRYVLFQDLMLF